jgi:hypothetical protein
VHETAESYVLLGAPEERIEKQGGREKLYRENRKRNNAAYPAPRSACAARKYVNANPMSTPSWYESWLRLILRIVL